ncbi:MAG: hypothetical protein IJW29_08305 [Clostridia bacterium]|nr:hypothetical protein [Clostridia bacterium]
MYKLTKAITAESFWKDFCKALEENGNEIQNVWNNKSAFTEFIIKKIFNSILNKNYGYKNEHQYEYLKIDLVGWKDLDKSELGAIPKNFESYFWAFDVAIEHENDKEKWMDEVIKLSYINCPLRIVIGYAPKDMQEEYLSYVSKALQILNEKYQSIREGQKFMIILGDSGLDGKDVSIENYTPYLYNLDQKCFKNKKADWMQKE